MIGAQMDIERPILAAEPYAYPYDIDPYATTYNNWEDLEREYNGTLEEIYDDYLNAPEPTGTGIREVDAALNGGLRPGVSVLGGEPGAGKSAFALQMAFSHAFAGKKVVYVSLEMSRGQCLYRVCSYISTLQDMARRGVKRFAWADAENLIKAENMKLDAAETEEETAAIMHDLTHGGNPYMTAARIFKEHYAHNFVIAANTELRKLPNLLGLINRAVKLGAGLVVVDYLQLVESAAGVSTEYDRVTEISKALSACGHELGIPILALSSLSRQGAATKDEMHSFKGSGSIEYDGECTMTLRQDTDAALEDDRRPTLLKVSKNRHGPFVDSKPVMLSFDGAHNAFAAR